MSGYGENEEQEILRSMDEMNRAMTPFVISLAQIELFGIALGRYLALGVFPLAAIGFLYAAYLTELHSYWNLLFLELSSGFLFFAAAPRIIHLGRRYRWQVPLLGAAVAGLLLYLAYDCEKYFSQLSQHACEFLQAALIEYSIAMILMVGLEIAMAPWLNDLALKYRQARDNLQDKRAPVPKLAQD